MSLLKQDLRITITVFIFHGVFLKKNVFPPRNFIVIIVKKIPLTNPEEYYWIAQFIPCHPVWIIWPGVSKTFRIGWHALSSDTLP